MTDQVLADAVADATMFRKRVDELLEERARLQQDMNALQDRTRMVEGECEARLAQADVQIVELRSQVTQHRGTAEALRVQAEALRVQAEALRVQARTFQEKHDKLLEALFEEADERGWCDEFDEKMIELGYEGRERTYEVEVEMRVSFTLTRSKSITTRAGKAAAIEEAEGEDWVDEVEGLLSGVEYANLEVEDIEADLS